MSTDEPVMTFDEAMLIDGVRRTRENYPPERVAVVPDVGARQLVLTIGGMAYRMHPAQAASFLRQLRQEFTGLEEVVRRWLDEIAEERRDPSAYRRHAKARAEQERQEGHDAAATSYAELIAVIPTPTPKGDPQR